MKHPESQMRNWLALNTVVHIAERGLHHVIAPMDTPEGYDTLLKNIWSAQRFEEFIKWYHCEMHKETKRRRKNPGISLLQETEVIALIMCHLIQEHPTATRDLVEVVYNYRQAVEWELFTRDA